MWRPRLLACLSILSGVTLLLLLAPPAAGSDWTSPRLEAENVSCAGQAPVAVTQASGGMVRQAFSGSNVTCSYTVPPWTTAVLKLYTCENTNLRSATVAVTGSDPQAADAVSVPAAGAVACHYLVWTSEPLPAGAFGVLVVGTASSFQLDYFVMETTSQPSPSPSPVETPVPGSPSPVPMYVYESPVADCAVDTCTVTLAAGSTVGLSESQAMALWFFLGTLMLLALVAFLRREGRAFRA